VSLQTDNNYPSQAVLEAMACGNAIIATDVGDTRMFVNEQNGWLIEHGVEPLVEAVRHCLKNQQESHAKGDFATNFVRANFTLERAMAYYKSILFPEYESTR
jgi:glycosyltransferase involved in cell wall biosynthesis